MATSRATDEALIETTSGHAVALRVPLPKWQDLDGKEHNPIALLLPDGANLASWFRAFLSDIHELDIDRVPLAPPRLSQPWDWYTPEERTLASQLDEIEHEFQSLGEERDRRKAQLTAAGDRADAGIRRILWKDGKDLVASASEVLLALGFRVRDMDDELPEGQPKREDLRLTLEGDPHWEAIVEVKGYTNGIRTNDALQIRQHRDHYIVERGRPPNVTIWLSNPQRSMDPSSRPVPDNNVNAQATTIAATHVLASDLYKQWALVAAGKLDAEAVVQSLKDAEPGLWVPPVAT